MCLPQLSHILQAEVFQDFFSNQLHDIKFFFFLKKLQNILKHTTKFQVITNYLEMMLMCSKKLSGLGRENGGMSGVVGASLSITDSM